MTVITETVRDVMDAMECASAERAAGHNAEVRTYYGLAKMVEIDTRVARDRSAKRFAGDYDYFLSVEP